MLWKLPKTRRLTKTQFLKRSGNTRGMSRVYLTITCGLIVYFRFLRARFNHPPDFRRRDRSPSFSSDGASIRNSIISVSSEGQDAMWEYQSYVLLEFVMHMDTNPLFLPKVRCDNDLLGPLTAPRTWRLRDHRLHRSLLQGRRLLQRSR